MSNKLRTSGWIATGFFMALLLGLSFLYVFEQREAQRRLFGLRRLQAEASLDIPDQTPTSRVTASAPVISESRPIMVHSAEAQATPSTVRIEPAPKASVSSPFSEAEIASKRSEESPSPSELFSLDQVDQKFELQVKQLVLRIRAAAPDEQIRLKNELRGLTVKQFEHRQKRRQQELDSLTQRIQILKSKQMQRQRNEVEIVNRRMMELLKTDLENGWDDPDGVSDQATNDAVPNGDSQDNDKMLSTGGQAVQSSSEKRSEPTFSGVTMSEWMRLLAQERNQEKVAEAMLAMNHLADDANPRQLVRVVLKTLRRYGTRLEHPYVINDIPTQINLVAMLLLTTLPSDIVVDEIIAELKSLREQGSGQQPAQDFLWSYFRSLKTQFVQGNLYSSAGTLAYQLRSARLQTSLTNLRSEIHRKSRSIVGELIDVGYSDENSLEWATTCAGQIVQISGQTIRTYPELIPFVEREFDRLVANPLNTATISRSTGSYPAILLGESGIRVPEILDYASKQLMKEILSGPSAGGNMFGQAGPDFVIFDDALNCLKAIAVHSPAAVNLLVEKLNQNWERVISDFNELNGAKNEDKNLVTGEGPREQNLQLKIQICGRVIDALRSIGVPASDSILLLQRISQSPISSRCIPNHSESIQIPGPNGVPVIRARNLQDISEAAIKAIQEAKPKESPEPLPEDAAKTSTTTPDAGSNSSGNQ